ncbi:nickel-dependent hydrogenase large subunit [Sulfurimonas sp. HSL-3221]|uniref:nickel-dependent hydrogenase large subunit n=1 Tax=Sulfurimonadaceae TaxID=2771471 RepID=UPI001E4BE822|nr:nickel-dependent hydrogenase large subunit [Sulfurimonas sp. HSL-3221]UFS62505.1 nickel-dependent hydrogenase large subunit [Sulfurimonas sp. HSL-3221]
MMTRALIEHIEGEASLYFDTRGEKITWAEIAFPHFRGMERMLEGRKATDALVITPRVCGICGHAHLMATVRAIEAAYAQAGYPVVLTRKARSIRELTLVLEMIQNHFKWLYLVILPELEKLGVGGLSPAPLKGAYAAAQATKILALFAGQWPHSSYMIPGGVTCDPTHLERIQAAGLLDELIGFFEKETAGVGLDALLSFASCREFNPLQSDLGRLEKGLIATEMHKKGMAYDRFVVLGEHGFTVRARLKHTRPMKADPCLVSTEPAVCRDETSHARNVRYGKHFYEVGPLARSISADTALIKNMHRRYKDSVYTRVMARAYETAVLLQHAKTLLAELELSEPSYVPPVPLERISATGEGIVEAPRGPLMHRMRLERGIVAEYKIITPTQWNLGSSVMSDPAPAQKAMVGAADIAEATFIFRSFDVCSVCTTH